MRKPIGRKVAARLATILFILSLVMYLGAGAIAADGPKDGPAPERIHPLLSKLTDEQPDGTFRVIVQGDRDDDDLASVAERLGGKGKRSLSVIRGFSTELSAKAIRALAKHPNVRWISIDAPMTPAVDVSHLATDYPLAVRAPEVWNGPASITGAGVAVAVLDSGIARNTRDFGRRIVGGVTFQEHTKLTDGYGHGTHVAGIIASNGDASRGKYIGIAPGASLVNVKVSDDQGSAYISDVIAGLEWVIANRAAYNIRVVNLSLASSVAESYLTSPLDAAVERAWFAGIVVVVSAGNKGPNSVLYPPANDPFVITVGAVDTNGTAGIGDDTIPEWSSFGTTQDGFAKPEVAAPGRRIISNLASRNSVLAQTFPDRIVDRDYIRLSGTSMAAPVVSGIAALALQAHPGWTPDQVKAALIATARSLGAPGSGSGEVDAAAVVSSADPGPANEGLQPSSLAAEEDAEREAAGRSSTTWNGPDKSVTWNGPDGSVTWNGPDKSVTWNDASQDSLTWNSVTKDSNARGAAFPD